MPENIVNETTPERQHDGMNTLVDTSGIERAVDNACDLIDTLRTQRDELLSAAKHAVMEWRLHGQLTDSCRVLEAAIAKAERRS